MKHSFLLLYLFLTLLMVQSCKEKQHEIVAQPLSLTPQETSGVYFTQDHHRNAVLCWTEKDQIDSLYRLKYAIFDVAADSFAAAVTVPGSAGMTAVAESAGKVAFKSDGTVMALFGKRFLQEKNPYAGAIYYTFSSDGGKNWTGNQFLHSDTAHRYGRSFFDLSTLKDGEIAAVWLDGRFGKTQKGSALYLARTEKGNGFTGERCLEKGTCECCRTNLLQDAHGNIHIAYRSIMFPSTLAGKQVRDMAYIYSNDNGASFSSPQTLSEDHWQIEGCPHSGPSLAVTGQTVNGVWFTAGGTPGVYFTKAAIGSDFEKRTLLSNTGRHPQMLALPDGRIAIVFEENEHGHAMAGSHQPAGLSKIVLTILKDGREQKRITISEGQHIDHHAVLSLVKDDMIIAWSREEHGKSNIFYTRLRVPDYR
ncbi:sialidase family protein [Pedobacter immunditicola]|uniref:sialidase family protein n=1 Tax=Pedobacter immunditicola TaxID=3133440 RepID=UPI0030A0B79E